MHDADQDAIGPLLARAAEIAADFYHDLDRRPVFPANRKPGQLMEALGRLPEDGSAPEAVLDELARVILPAAAANAGPRFFGWIIGSPTPISAAADAIAGAVNQNAGGWSASPAASEVDELVTRWIADLIGYPGGGGTLTTGGSMANFHGLAAGIVEGAARLGVDVVEDGVRALPADPVVYASSEVHSSVPKALSALGLGRRCLATIRRDAEFRVDVGAMAARIAQDRAAGRLPLAIVGTAGTVNTGAFDDLSALADLASAEGLWFHVDGAYGGFARLSPRTASYVAGIERADSVVLDPHKQLGAPFDVGTCLVRDEETLVRAFSLRPAYLVTTQGKDAFERSFELSRRWRGLKVWASLRRYGRRGYRQMLETQLDVTRAFVEAIAGYPELELAAPVPYTAVCFRYRSRHGTEADQITAALSEALTRTGSVLVAGTRLDDRPAVRACFISFRTTVTDSRLLADLAVQEGRRLAGGGGHVFREQGAALAMSGFDERAREWDADPARVERARAVAGKIRAMVPLTPTMTALEYGCGTGLLGFALQPYVGQITLADSSEGMLAVLRQKIASSRAGNVQATRLDLTTDAVPSDRYELICSLMALHHIPDTDRILRDFHTLLHPGGYLCVADLDQEDGSFHGPGFSGHNGFDRDALAARAAHAGFHSVRFATAFQTARKVDERDRAFPAFLMVAERR